MEVLFFLTEESFQKADAKHMKLIVQKKILLSPEIIQNESYYPDNSIAHCMACCAVVDI